MKNSPTPFIKPFLKWPGGKFRLLPTLKLHLPERSRLIEPFVGAGALFLNSPYQEVIVNDINTDLINLYQQLKASGKQLIKEAKKLFVTKNNKALRYYHIRQHFNNSNDLWERAALFIYLNKHGYNGLCRYNLKGYFNVPFGQYKAPYFPEKELIFFCQRAQNVNFFCEDYVTFIDRFQSNLKQSAFYCDPPYAPLSKTANFTGYAAHRFTLADQKKLAHLASHLKKKGAIVLISNHDTPFTRKIYHEASLSLLKVRRTISCQGNQRNQVGELIACYAP